MTTDRTPRILGITAIVAATLAIAGGFSLVGSPTTRRAQRMDSTRVQNLQSVARTINSPYQLSDKENGTAPTLPESLDALSVRQDAWIAKEEILDPVTKQPYEYRIVDATHYELCATFALATPENDQSGEYYYGNNSEFWKHPAGRHCYAIDAEVSI